jgi:beta-lactamase regulating signal transducer with metallopeptidase domain
MIRSVNEIVVTLGASPAFSLVMKGTVVLALGLVSAGLARNSRAAVRHALLASVFGVLLTLPVVSVIAPLVPIVVPVTTYHSIGSPLFDDIAAPSRGVLLATPHSDAGAGQGFPHIRPSMVLLYGWFVGATLFVILIIRDMLQVRWLRRFALPSAHGGEIAEELAPGVRRRVEVLIDEKLSGPLTCGVLRPAIILPADAEDWNRQDLERALIHELEHVRRHDWAVQCLARIACAAYWFHPMVWAAWRQLRLEAERACDDAVLRQSGAIAYADQLLGLARRLSGVRKSPALAMANRSDLSARVGALLDGRQRRGPAGVLPVAAACIGGAAIVLTMSPLRMVAAPQSAANLTFEVASVKRTRVHSAPTRW